jgi:hypothetical protein
VDELGLTHQELARHLWMLVQLGSHLDKLIAKETSQTWFTYRGRRFEVELWGYAGSQESPFEDGTSTCAEARVHNLDNGKKLWFSLLVPEMIERYGFYEGCGTRYRVDPRDIVDVLDFLKDRAKNP